MADTKAGKLFELSFAKGSKLIYHFYIALNFALREFTRISFYCYIIGDDQFQLKLELWFVHMLEMLGTSLKYYTSFWQQCECVQEKMHDRGNFNLHFSKNND